MSEREELSIPNIDYKNISEIEKYSINELFFGDICKHSIYISNRTNTIALIDDLDNIMIYNFIFKESLLKIISYYESNNKSIDTEELTSESESKPEPDKLTCEPEPDKIDSEEEFLIGLLMPCMFLD